MKTLYEMKISDYRNLCILGVLVMCTPRSSSASVQYCAGKSFTPKPTYTIGVNTEMSGTVNIRQTIEALGNGACFARDGFVGADPEVHEIMRSYQNGHGNAPSSQELALKDSTCRPLPYDQAYLHDFNDKVAGMCNMSVQDRINCYIDALKEYMGSLPSGTVLNVDGQHNAKIVCEDGREYVFDANGKLIAEGINQGTFNISNPENALPHFFYDVIGAVVKIPDKTTISRDECVRMLENYLKTQQEIVHKAEADTKALFSGKSPGSSKSVDIDNFLEKLRRGCDEDNGAELAAEALKEDGTGIALAEALLGDDESKVPEAMRKFNENVGKSSEEVGRKFQKWQKSINRTNK